MNNNLLEALIDSAINYSSDKEGSLSLVILNHLRQMKLFGIRKGIELYPNQDSPDKLRYKFISRVWKENRLSLYLGRIMDLFCATGNVLYLLRPNQKGSYDIRFFDGEQYRTYYDSDGNLVEVIILYSYSVKSTMGNNFDTQANKKWIKLVFTPTTITRYFYDNSPGLNIESVASSFGSPGETFNNAVGFIPCIECNNNAPGIGQRGYSDFLPLRRQIESLEDDYFAINNNLTFFGGTTLVTSRSDGEVVEAVESPSNVQISGSNGATTGWAAMGASYSNVSMYPRYLNKQGNIGQKIKLKQVIGNVQGDERMAFLTPDPITPDHSQYLREKREAIHFALGGIDELGVNASATAYEMKVVYGKVAATASTKAETLFEYGLCQIFEMAIQIEEMVYINSMSQVLKKPPEEITPNLLAELYQKNKLPNVPGLPLLGEQKIKWRWTGAVFEDSSRDVLDRSIVVRNLQEQGVNALESLGFLFPDKTDIEKESMLAEGYPFRYVNSIVGTLGQIVQLYQSTLSVPNPENPNVPLASTINVNPLLDKGLNTIMRELSYQKSYEPTNDSRPTPSSVPSNSPTTSSPGTIPTTGGSLSAAGFWPTNPEFTSWNLSATNSTSVPAGITSSNSTDNTPTNQLSYELPVEGAVHTSAVSPRNQPPTIPAIYGEYDELAQSIWGSQWNKPATTNRSSNGKSKKK